MTSTTIELPFPVPLHALWKKHKGGGGIPTDRYKAYGREAWAAIAQQKPTRFKGPVFIHVVLVAPDNRKRDGDNVLKCLFDTLKTHNVIEDDNSTIIADFHVSWKKTGAPCTVRIKPWSASLAEALEAVAA